LASVLNQNVTAWRSAPAAVTIERQLVRWIAQALGCQELSGSLCGGGSSANLMALAMAREARVPANECGAQPGIVYVSSEAHMSMAKAVALLGLGRRNLRQVAVDQHFRMSAAALEAAIAEDRAAGRALIAVVASAGTVSTGAIDPLEQIGAICRAQGLWLHVDGAYGLLAALAAPEKFRGLSAADSLSLDLHKWLYQRFRALKTWLSLRYHGLNAFRAAILCDLEHARQLADSIRATPQLELLAPVELSTTEHSRPMSRRSCRKCCALRERSSHNNDDFMAGVS
jgi:aromatic-L-amino-acid/L-tryptophan decarboxylase